MRVRISSVLAVLLLAPFSRAQTTNPLPVAPSRETAGALGGGQAIQGAAVWVNPSNPSLSQLFVADNFGGLLAYDVDGNLRVAVQEGGLAGVDVQDGLIAGADGGTQPLIMVANVTSGLVGYTIDPVSLGISTAGLANFTPPDLVPNSVALYANAAGRLYVFAGSSTGVVGQYQLTTGADGGIGATALRTFNVGNAVAGLVVDDAQGVLYVAAQGQGIWRYGAEPTAGTTRTQVDTITGGNLRNPLGGLALYPGPTPTDGYLLAATGQDNAVHVYSRNTAAQTHLGAFSVVADAGIDPVDAPRLLAVSNRPLGSVFSQGMAAVHDSANPAGNENLKLVPWQTIAVAFEPDLLVYTGASQTTDGGTADGGAVGNGDGGIALPPGTGTPIIRDPEENGCGCSASSVPGTLLLLMVGVLLVRRRAGDR